MKLHDLSTDVKLFLGGCLAAFQNRIVTLFNSGQCLWNILCLER